MSQYFTFRIHKCWFCSVVLENAEKCHATDEKVTISYFQLNRLSKAFTGRRRGEKEQETARRQAGTQQPAGRAGGGEAAPADHQERPS